MTIDPLLPPGLKVDAVLGEDEGAKVRLTIAAVSRDRADITATVVFDTARQARAFGALLIKQANLIDETELGLRVVGGREG